MTAAPLDPSLRGDLARHLLSRFRAVVASKGDVGALGGLARAFDVARLFGQNVPSSAEFLDEFWTTVGPVILRPRGTSTDLGAHLRVVCHEVTHVVQFWRDGAGFVAAYANPRGRAELEAEAERGAMEAWWAATGELPASLDALDVARHGYAFDPAPGAHDDLIDLCRDLLEQALPSVAAGALGTDVGIAARAWVESRKAGGR